ncbi:E3 ubiquitin-protein ligase PPP1R11-like [Amblyomma americanum]
MSNTATAAEVTASGSLTQQLNPDQQAPAEKPLKITKKGSKQKIRRTVSWTTDTVDNEHLNRKSSKCCCIYVKPTKFGDDEPDDEEGDCENCRGHFPRGGKHRAGHPCGPAPEPEMAAPPVVPSATTAPVPPGAPPPPSM